MSDRYFLDTNIVVYAYDSYQPQKQEKAQLFITEGIERENVVLSAQVLSEFLMLLRDISNIPCLLMRPKKLFQR